MKKLQGMDVTERLNLYRMHTGIFYPLAYKPVAVSIFFFSRSQGTTLLLAFNKTLSMPNMDIYDIRVGATNGLLVGYLMYSPLNMKADSYYTMFYRPSFKPETLLEEASTLPKRLISRNLVFHGNEVLHYIVNKKVNHPLVNFIAGIVT